MDNKLHLENLRSLGLSENEARVYVDLLAISPSTPQAISKRTAIARTTVYWALDGLKKRGLVLQERKRGTTFYAVTQPQALVRMVQDERHRLAQQLALNEEIAKEMAASITPFAHGLGALIPKVQFFEGEKGVRAMLYDYHAKWQESMAAYDFTWWGYQDPTFVEHYAQWLEFTWQKRKKEEKMQVLTNQTATEAKLTEKAPLPRSRYVPPEYLFSSTIWVLGDFMVLIMCSQRPHYALQLINPAFASNLRTLFQILWEKIF